MRRRMVALLGCAALAGCSGASPARPPVRRAARPPRTSRAHRAALPGAAAQHAELRRLAREGLPVYCGGRHKRLVALTFDDGPGAYTGLALKELRQARARATFFLVGRSIASYPAWPRRERALAAIGSHTMTHPYLPHLAPAAAAAEIAGGRTAALRAAGGPVDLFRPPYAGHTPAIDRQVRRDGMVEVLWDVDSQDSAVAIPRDYRAISAIVRHRIRPGSIVLMHENRGQTIRALRTILPALRRRGLRAVTVPELLAADPPSQRQLKARARGCEVGEPGTAGG